jgi:O-antigen/teichoic acid export membrane protein
LFTTFLGTKWHEAGILGQILVPWMALAAISSTLGVAYQVFNRQGEGFIWNIILLVVRFCALYFGGLFFGPRGTLGLFVAASAAVVAWLIVRPLSLLSVSRRWSAATIARGYVEPLLLLVPAGVAYWCFDAQLISLAALAGATFVHALLLCRRYPKILRPLLSRLPARWATSLRFN